MKVSILSGTCLALLAGAQGALAQGSNDMLKPSQVNYEGESSNPANDSGFFVGAGATFGQARTTEDGSSPGTAWFLNVEPGYQVNRGSWNRFEVGAQFLTGGMSVRYPDRSGGKVDMKVKYGVLARAGWGYSLGSGTMGVLKVGVGPVAADFEGEANGVKSKADDLSGLATQVGYEVVMPINNTLDFNAGFDWNHMEFDVNDVKRNGQTEKLDRNVVINIPSLALGVRARF